MEPKQILIWLHYLLIVNTFVKNDGVFFVQTPKYPYICRCLSLTNE